MEIQVIPIYFSDMIDEFRDLNCLEGQQSVDADLNKNVHGRY